MCYLQVFRDDEDREMFLATLDGVVKRFGWRCHACCLMGNHVHLLRPRSPISPAACAS